MEYQKDKIIAPAQGCEGQRGAEPHSRSKPSPTDKLFIIGNGIGIRNIEIFYKYFPLLTNRSSKSLYQLLFVVFSNPLRTEHHLRSLILGNSNSTRKNLLILCDLGYIQQENKPRKILAFEAYTIDKVYRITAKGVKVLSAITGY